MEEQDEAMYESITTFKGIEATFIHTWHGELLIPWCVQNQEILTCLIST